MRLAKRFLDVGLFTNNLEPMLAFWQGEIGLPFEEALPTGGGTVQYRHGLNGGVLKLNHSREALPSSPPSGYREILIARADCPEPVSLNDPDGNHVTLVPPGHRGVTSAAVEIAVRSIESASRYYGEALGLDEAGAATFLAGESLVFLRQGAAITPGAPMRGRGYRYLTLQVWDCDAECAQIAARGGELAMSPRTMAAVARFGFVRDPDGNMLEISQRASLTGPLPPDTAPEE